MQDYYSDRYGLPADHHGGAGNGDRPTGAVRGGAMREMIVKGIRIDDTFAEAFNMRATAVVITADSARWARQAAVTMTGFATSVIGCGCEAGIDSELSPRDTPDRRPGVRVLLFAVSTSELQKQLQNRVGQCVLTTRVPPATPDCRVKRRSSSATHCASSAMAGRSPNVSAASTTGACRSWMANSFAKQLPD